MSGFRMGRRAFAAIIITLLFVNLYATATLFALRMTGSGGTSGALVLVLAPVVWLVLGGLGMAALALRLKDVGLKHVWAVAIPVGILAALIGAYNLLMGALSHHPYAGHTAQPIDFGLKGLLTVLVLLLMVWPGQKHAPVSKTPADFDIPPPPTRPEPAPGFGRRIS